MRCVNIPEIYDEYDEFDEFKRQKEKEYNKIQKELDNEQETKIDKIDTEQEIRNYIISGNNNHSDTMDAKERNFIIHGKEAPKQFELNVKNENKIEPMEKPKNKIEIENQNKKTTERISSERSIIISQKDLKKTLIDLKTNKNLSLNQISKKIGTNIKNLAYGYSNSIKENHFKKLELLANQKIPHQIKPLRGNLYPTKDKSQAEMTGILLGDGHLNSKIYRIQVSLNGVKESKYVEYVKNKFKTMYGIEPKEIWERNMKNSTGKEQGMFLYINSKRIFNELLDHGLKSGNKVKNQISVPNWIKSDKNLSKHCLRGLFDTDGSISISTQNKSLALDFSNASLPLVKDFKSMCETLKIDTSPNITQRSYKNQKTQNISTTYRVYINKKDAIAKFIYKIKPNKWKMNRDKIDKQLKSLNSNIEEAFKYKNKSTLDKYALKLLESQKK